MIEQKNNFSAVMTVETAVKTADGNGTGVDLTGFQSALIIAQIGASGDTLSGSVYILIEIEESDDNSTFTDVADEHIIDAVSGLNTGTICKVDASSEDQAVYIAAYIGGKKYIRAVVNVVGTHTNGTPIGVCVLRGNPRYLPV